MGLTRKTIVLLALGVAFAAAWSSVRAGEQDVVVLRTFDAEGNDYFTTLWWVEDPAGFVWIRANRPDRRWLAHVRESDSLRLGRGARTRSYAAKVFDDARTRQIVAPWFRAKYGLADRWREWSTPGETVPVRLRAL